MAYNKNDEKFVSSFPRCKRCKSCKDRKECEAQEEREFYAWDDEDPDYDPNYDPDEWIDGCNACIYNETEDI